MGISRTQFFATSQNGKAMVKMLALRGDKESASAGDVELVHEILDWLCSQRRKGIETQALARGRSPEAAKLMAEEQVAAIQKTADACNDRNVVHVAESVIDEIFKSHFVQGPQQYQAIMKWFADKLREKIKDDDL
jgi:hypothetical protein